VHLKPDCAEFHGNLSSVLRDQGRTDEAIAALKEAVRLEPDNSEVLASLGNLLKDQGRPEEALVCYDRAIALRPALHASRVFLLQYHPDYDAAAILREQQEWDSFACKPLRQSLPFEQ